ncbi:MAG: hypothetical protein WCG52_10170 [bacterium]
MSDMNEWFEDHQGQVNGLSQFAAIQQRNRLIAQQRENATALRQQTAALEKQNKIETERSQIEQQRLELERQRAEAEQSERNLQKAQAEHLKDLRNLMADISIGLSRIRKNLAH